MPDASNLPIDIGHWLVALVPIVVLLVLLAVLRWKAPEAGPLGMFAAAGVALLFFRTPLETLAVGAGKGVWDALFILFVVWPALLLYRVTQRAGAFDALRHGISRFSRNQVFIVLAFGWVFASFLQGIAGFGTPIAVVAPLLVALGVKPVYAVAIPLIGHAWANMFGTLAVGWLATLQVVDLQDETTTAFQTAALLWIPNLVAGFTIAWMVGRGAGAKLAVPFVLIVSLIHGGLQLLITLWNPVLSTFLAATAALLVLYPLSRWERYSEPMEGDGDRPAMADDGPAQDEEGEEPVMGLPLALAPYAVLTVASLLVLAIPPVEEAFGDLEVGLPFAAVDTGYEVEQDAEEPYSPFSPLTHPGAFLLVAGAASYALYRAKGMFDRHGERSEDQVDEGSLLASVASDAVPSSVAIVSFLVLAQVMSHSGQTEVLALGIEAVAPALVFALLANVIGVVGAFMTSSNTASNVLFAELQQTVAEAEGLSEAAIIGAQSTGGAIGNAIAPANVVLGTTTAGIVGEEGQVLRKTLPWTLAVSALIGLATLALI